MARTGQIFAKIAKYAWRGVLASLILATIIVAVELGAEFAFDLEANAARLERFQVAFWTSLFVLVGFPAVAIMISELVDKKESSRE